MKVFFRKRAVLKTDMKKKIIFVTEALWIGGIETALMNLLDRLDYEKYEVTCLILQNDQTLSHRLPQQVRLLVADRHGVVSFQKPYRYTRLYHLTEKSQNPSRLHRAMMWAVPGIKWVENRLYIRYIRENLKDERFDTCVIYSDRTAEAAVRGICAERYLMFYHHGAMRREYHDEIGYRKSEKIIAVSNAVEQKLREYRPKYAHKMMTIHNLTDVEGIRRKAEAPIDEVFSPDQFHIVSCGRISREKGMDLAVEACAKLVEMGHDNIHWWIVGGGPAEGEVRDKIAELHMESYVTMLGMKNNPYPYIKRADLYVQPSRFEGYPVAILEALVLGRPVVSTNNGGAKEIFANGNYGMLTEIACNKIAECITKLLINVHLRESLKKSVENQDMNLGNQRTLNQLHELL